MGKVCGVSSVSCLAVFLSTVMCGPAVRGDSTTFLFSGPVLEVIPFGPDTIDDEFSLGETVNISLTYDPDTPEDSNTVGDPDNGIYADPMISFSFDFVESEREFDMTGGDFQVVSVVNDLNSFEDEKVDNVGTAAQTIVGGTISGTVDGSPLIFASLQLIDFETDGSDPDMLSDASLPASPFEPDQAFIDLAVDAGTGVTVIVELSDTGSQPVPGDANNDGKVDAADLNILALSWQQSVAPSSGADFNGDGFIDAADLNELALNWQFGVDDGLIGLSDTSLTIPPEFVGAKLTVPEPGLTIVLAVLAALTILPRRRDSFAVC